LNGGNFYNVTLNISSNCGLAFYGYDYSTSNSPGMGMCMGGFAAYSSAGNIVNSTLINNGGIWSKCEDCHGNDGDGSSTRSVAGGFVGETSTGTTAIKGCTLKGSGVIGAVVRNDKTQSNRCGGLVGQGVSGTTTIDTILYDYSGQLCIHYGLVTARCGLLIGKVANTTTISNILMTYTAKPVKWLTKSTNNPEFAFAQLTGDKNNSQGHASGQMSSSECVGTAGTSVTISNTAFYQTELFWNDDTNSDKYNSKYGSWTIVPYINSSATTTFQGKWNVTVSPASGYLVSDIYMGEWKGESVYGTKRTSYTAQYSSSSTGDSYKYKAAVCTAITSGFSWTSPSAITYDGSSTLTVTAKCSGNNLNCGYGTSWYFHSQNASAGDVTTGNTAAGVSTSKNAGTYTIALRKGTSANASLATNCAIYRTGVSAPAQVMYYDGTTKTVTINKKELSFSFSTVSNVTYNGTTWQRLASFSVTGMLESLELHLFDAGGTNNANVTLSSKNNDGSSVENNDGSHGKDNAPRDGSLDYWTRGSGDMVYLSSYTAGSFKILVDFGSKSGAGLRSNYTWASSYSSDSSRTISFALNPKQASIVVEDARKVSGTNPTYIGDVTASTFNAQRTLKVYFTGLLGNEWLSLDCECTSKKEFYKATETGGNNFAKITASDSYKDAFYRQGKGGSSGGSYYYVCGRDAGSYNITFSASDDGDTGHGANMGKACNYSISNQVGTFTVAQRELSLDITKNIYTYNGQFATRSGNTRQSEWRNCTTVTISNLVQGESLCFYYRASSAAASGHEIYFARRTDSSSYVLPSDKDDYYNQWSTSSQSDTLSVDFCAANAGSYTFYLSKFENGDMGNVTKGQKTNYKWSSSYDDQSERTVTFTVNQIGVTLSWSNLSFTYNGSSQAPTCTYSSGILSGDTCTVSSVSGAQKNAGSHTASVTLSNSNYTGTLSKSFTISKVSLTVKANNHSIIYGAAPATNGVSYSGFKGSDTSSVVTGTPSLSTNYTQYGNVGSYTITPNVSGLSATNYTFSASTGTLTVTQRTATLSWGTASFNYNGANQCPTCTVSNTVNSDTCTVTVTGASVNAGDYTATASSLSNGNYALPSSKTKSFTIAKVAITVKANNHSIVYGAAPATNGYTYSGYKGSDTSSVITGTPSLSTNYTQYGNVGSYTITPNVSGLSATNYTFSASTGTLTVTQRTATLNWGTASFNYNGANQCPTCTVSNTVNSDTCTVTVTGASVSAGDYTATASSLSNGNYALPSSKTKSFSIAKVDLTVTAKAKTITYGDAPTNSGVTYSGFVGDDTFGCLSGTLSYDYSYNQYGNAGSSYTITPKGYTSSNYNISFVAGTLTVNKRTLTLSWGTTAFTYDGSAHAPTCTPGNIVHSDTVTVSVSGQQTNASDSNYTATASLTAGGTNYQLPSANTTTFTIGRAFTAIPTVTIYKNDDTTGTTISSGGTKSKTYCGLAYTFNYTAATSKYTASGGSSITNVGSSTLTLKVTSNYYWGESGTDTTDKTFKITVTKATITITAKAKTITYGAAPTNNGYTYSGLVNSEAFADVVTGSVSSYTYSYTQYGNVGSYTITPVVSGLSATNYSFATANGTLTVGKKTLSWASPTYNGATVNWSAPTGTVNSDAVTFVYSLKLNSAERLDSTSALTYTAVTGGSYTLSVSLSGTKAGNYTAPSSKSLTVYCATFDNPVGSTTNLYAFKNSGNTQTVTIVADPSSNQGYDFGGWYIGDTKYTAGSSYTLTADTTFTARWTVKTYKATFRFRTDEQDSFTTFGSQTNVEYGDALSSKTAFNNFAKSGWVTTNGWHTTSATTGDAVTTITDRGTTGSAITYYTVVSLALAEGDFNGDGTLNDSDITLFRKYMAGGYFADENILATTLQVYNVAKNGGSYNSKTTYFIKAAAKTLSGNYNIGDLYYLQQIITNAQSDSLIAPSVAPSYDESSGGYKITWNAVKNVSAYEVKIDGGSATSTTTRSVDLKTTTGTHTVSVRSTASGYTSSDWSTYTYTVTAPYLNVTVNGSTVSWSGGGGTNYVKEGDGGYTSSVTKSYNQKNRGNNLSIKAVAGFSVADATNYVGADCIVNITTLGMVTPTLSGTTVSWSAVSGATKYAVKVDSGEWIEQSTLSYTLPSTTGSHTIRIKSRATGAFESDETSVSFSTKAVSLSDLTLKDTTVSWTAVANSVSVKEGSGSYNTTASTSYTATGVGTHTVYVKAQGGYSSGDNTYYYASSPITKSTTVTIAKLSAPVLSISASGITWSAVSNANKYATQLDTANYQDNTSRTVALSSVAGSHILYVKSIGNGTTYLDSDTASISYTTTVVTLSDLTISGATASWTTTALATYVKEGTEEYTETTSLTKTVSGVGTHNISVKAVGGYDSTNAIYYFATSDIIKSATIVISTLATPSLMTNQSGANLPTTTGIAWEEVSGATSYKVSVDNGSWTDNTTGVKSFSTVAGSHTIRVKAVSSLATYVDSAIATFSYTTIAVAVGTITINETTASWATGTNGYAIYVKDGSEGVYTPTTSTSYTVTGVGTHNVYVKAVSGYDGTNNYYYVGADAEQSSADIVIANLSAPSFGTMTSSSKTVSWGVVTGATKYQYKLDSGDWTDNTTKSVSMSTTAGEHTLLVKAIGNGTTYLDSAYSTFTYTTATVALDVTVDTPYVRWVATAKEVTYNQDSGGENTTTATALKLTGTGSHSVVITAKGGYDTTNKIYYAGNNVSSTKNITLTENLAAPVLSIGASGVSWSAITHATKYAVSTDGGDSWTETTSTTYPLETTAGNHSIKVKSLNSATGYIEGEAAPLFYSTQIVALSDITVSGSTASWTYTALNFYKKYSSESVYVATTDTSYTQSSVGSYPIYLKAEGGFDATNNIYYYGGPYEKSATILNTQTLATPVLSISGSGISWGAVSNITNYSVQVDSGSWTSQTATTLSLSTTVGEHTVKVKAVGDGTVYLQSSVATVTYTIANVALSNITKSDNEMSWTATGLTVQWKQPGSSSYSSTNGTTIYTAPANAGSYTLYVKATGGFDSSNNTYYQGSTIEKSATVTVADLNTPSPTVSSSSATKISWSAITGATKYQYSFNDGSSWTDTTSTSVNLNTTAGNYTIKVKAIGDGKLYLTTGTSGSYSYTTRTVALSDIVVDGFDSTWTATAYKMSYKIDSGSYTQMSNTNYGSYRYSPSSESSYSIALKAEGGFDTSDHVYYYTSSALTKSLTVSTANTTLNFSDGTAGSPYSSSNWTVQEWNSSTYGWDTKTASSYMNARVDGDNNPIVNMKSNSTRRRFLYSNGDSIGVVNCLSFRLANYWTGVDISYRVIVLDTNGGYHVIVGNINQRSESVVTLPATGTNGSDKTFTSFSYLYFDTIFAKSIIFDINSTGDSYMYLDDLVIKYQSPATTSTTSATINFESAPNMTSSIANTYERSSTYKKNGSNGLGVKAYKTSSTGVYTAPVITITTNTMANHLSFWFKNADTYCAATVTVSAYGSDEICIVGSGQFIVKKSTDWTQYSMAFDSQKITKITLTVKSDNTSTSKYNYYFDDIVLEKKTLSYTEPTTSPNSGTVSGSNLVVTKVLTADVVTNAVGLTTAGIRMLKYYKNDVSSLIEYTHASGVTLVSARYDETYNKINVIYRKNYVDTTIQITINNSTASYNVSDGSGDGETKALNVKFYENTYIAKVGGTVLCGSSSMQFWTNYVRDMYPMVTIDTGIGGTTAQDWAGAYGERLLFPYMPDTIVLYVGVNDLKAGVSGSEVTNRLNTLFNKIHTRLPDAKLYYVTINRVPNASVIESDRTTVNTFATNYKNSNSSWFDVITVDESTLFYSDVNGGGTYRDSMHLNQAGYTRWVYYVRKKVFNF